MNVRLSRIVPALCLAAGLPLTALRAQDPTPPGRWIGEVRIPGAPLGVAVTLSDAPPAGTIDIPAQAVADLALGPVTFDGSSVVFTIAGVAGNPTFDGTVSADGRTLSGTFTQAGGSFPFELTRSEAGARLELRSAITGDAGRVEGVWSGRLVAGGANLGLILHVDRNGDGSWTVTLDSPDQGAAGILVDTLDLDGDTVRLTLPAIVASFEGTIDEDENTISGTFMQMNAPLSLTLERGDQNGAMARPQNPRRPFPYEEIEVVVENPEAGVRLAGTLTRPASGGPFPAVILITGSGSQDRDQTLMGHKPFLVMSDYLTRRGLAVLRMDDRGVGGSRPATPAATTFDLASDISAAVRFLSGREDIASGRIGLLGHSEGGIIAPIVAAGPDPIAFVVMLAGSGIRGEEILYLQAAELLRRAGAGPDTIQRDRALRERMFEIVKEPSDIPLGDRMAAARDELVYQYAFGDRSAAPQVDALIDSYSSRWFEYFITYDPAEALMRVEAPVLALIGENDIQVPPDENLPAIEAALEAGGNPDYTVLRLPRLNHLFQTSETGAPAEYATIEETIAPAALELIGDWIETRVGPGI